VITGAAVCPSPPLLARELTGQAEVLPDLRTACVGAVRRLLAAAPDLVVVVGAGPVIATWAPEDRLDLSAYAPAQPERGKSGLPLALGLGALLLEEAGYCGPRCLQAVGQAASARECLRLGASLAGLAPRVALLAVGDGTARRTATAPGHLDVRAAAFDESVLRALADGDMAALAGLEENLARELMATGRAAWQVLAGAMTGADVPGKHTSAPAAEILYADAPFGVGYLVAVLTAECLPG